MIRKKIKLHSITSYLKTNYYSFFGVLPFLIGGFSHAQFKIDPAFEPVLNYQKKGGSNFKELVKIAEDQKLATSSIVLPNGKVEELFHVIVNTNSPKNFENSGLLIQSYSKSFFTALVTLDQINELSLRDDVINVLTPGFESTTNNIHVTESGARLLHQGLINNHAYKGQNVLIGVLDSGIDFTHPDFSKTDNPNETRILRLWDQTITPNNNETPPQNFNYGVEYTNVHINDEIDGTPANYVRQRDTNGHGTHVAGTAAGNGSAWGDGMFTGVAPEADLIIVKAGNGSFSRANIINGLDYFKKISEDLNRPIVVNFSLGGQANPHDGSLSHEIKVNEFTQSGPGRVVVISAGNDGGSNIHQEFALTPGEKKRFTLITSDTTSQTLTDLFTFYTYHRGVQDNSPMKVKIIAPNGDEFIRDISGTSTFTSPHPNNSGDIIITVDNFWDTASGKRFSTTSVKRSNVNVPTAGTYQIEIENTSQNNVIVDGWITSRNIGITNPNGDNNYTVGSPGNADKAITVANYTGLNFNAPRTSSSYWYSGNTMQDKNLSSSIGPRIDGYQKPDIAADGSYVISALSKDLNPAIDTQVDGRYYRSISGTSMSAPGVAGAVALLLEANRNLTSDEIKTAIINNSRKDQFTTNTFTPRLGHGKINIYNTVLEEVNKSNNNQSCPVGNYNILGYDTFGKSYDTSSLPASHQYSLAAYSGYNQRMALRYTPNMTGKLNSVYALLGVNNNNGIVTPFQIEVRKADANGKPGDLLGTKTFADLNTLQWYGWNTLDISDLNIDVQTNEDVFVVFISDNYRFRYFVDKDNVDGRTYFSSDQGATYGIDQSIDAKVRIIIHENTSAVHHLASIDSSTNQALNLGFNQVINNCEIVSRIESSGSLPLTGNTTTKLWIDNYDSKVVNRRIEVQNDTQNATGQLTLFFTQEEFDIYNSNNTIKLPSNSNDQENFAHLKVIYFNGQSADESGKHTTYPNSGQVIDVPVADIKWNNTYGYWEVKVDYLGAGGYFVSTNSNLNNVDQQLNQIAIYPNPVQNDLTIDLPINSDDASYRLVDLSGKIISQDKLKSNSNQLQLGHLSQGVYLLEIKTTKGTIHKKIIKK